MQNIKWFYDCEILEFPCPTVPRKSKEFGAIGAGNDFNVSFPPCAVVQRMGVRHGKKVEKLVFQVIDQDGERIEYVFGTNNREADSESIQVKQKIVKITGNANNRIVCGIQFHFEGGGSTEFFGKTYWEGPCDKFEIPINYFGGVYGNAGWSIDSFGVIDKYYEQCK